MDFVTIATVVAYLLFLASVGVIFKKMNKGETDYFRAGCRGTWWMVGMSMYMSGISTQTFVANAGVAFNAGLSVLLIYFTNTVTYLVLAFGIAGWYRQARVTTAAEMMRERFGPAFQQVTCYIGMTFGPLFMGFGLFLLSIFAHNAFDIPQSLTIIVLGGVVLFYTLAGGNWAVMAGDFLQSLVLLPMIILMAVLSLADIGWIPGILDKLNAQPGLAQELNFLSEPLPDGRYGLEWVLGVMLLQIFGNLNMGSGSRFFSAKDGRESKRAALLLLVVSSLAAVIYFIPPLVARLAYAAEVPSADASYVFMSKKLLPNGFLPLMVVAMFSAQLSTLDTALNGNSAVLIKNIYPPLMRLFGKKPSEDPVYLLKLGRIFTLVFGVAIVLFALYFAAAPNDKGVFEKGFKLSIFLSVPFMLPLFWGFYIRKTPWWTAWASVAGCIAVSFLASEFVYGLSSARTLFLHGLVSFAAFLAGRLHWEFSNPAHRAVITAFFERVHTPVDFEKEVGEDVKTDHIVLRSIGLLATILGCFFLIFLVFRQSSYYLYLGVFAVGASVLGMGLALLWAAKRLEIKYQHMGERPCGETPVK